MTHVSSQDGLVADPPVRASNPAVPSPHPLRADSGGLQMRVSNEGLFSFSSARPRGAETPRFPTDRALHEHRRPPSLPSHAPSDGARFTRTRTASRPHPLDQSF
jgi:hypothetical protein